MTETKQMLFARNLICVCVDSYEDADYQGLIYHPFSDEPVEFDGVSSLVLEMERLYDEWDFPQKGLADRKFLKHTEVEYKKDQDGDDRLPIEIIQENNGVRNVQNKKGRLGTFVVQVSFRQNATWQGHVIYQEKNEKKDFKSELELIKYIDAALGGK